MHLLLIHVENGKDLGDGLMKPCWIAVSRWTRSGLKAYHMGKLYAWRNAQVLMWKLFAQIRALLMNSGNMACSTSDDCHVITSYDRRAFKQTGTGHFSPIGGYHAESDMVLILDVARFKYPPHWVPLSLLWEAMNTVVEATGQHRGFMLVSRRQRSPALLYNLSCKHESWITTAKYFTDDVPLLLSSDNVKDIKDAISTVFSSLPSDFAEFIKWVAEIRGKEDGEEENGKVSFKEEVLKLVQETRLHKHVIGTPSSANYAMHPRSNDVFTALLLSLPPETWSAIKDEEVVKEISGLVCIRDLPSLIQEEVWYICKHPPPPKGLLVSNVSLLRSQVLHLRGQLLVLKRCKEVKD
ncbi:hypothetical protein ACS0TY_003173 [Phlomoides rotata]